MSTITSTHGEIYTVNPDTGGLMHIGHVEDMEMHVSHMTPAASHTPGAEHFTRGTENGKKLAARELSKELEDRDASCTEQIIYDWLKSRGVHMRIVNERWQFE